MRFIAFSFLLVMHFSVAGQHVSVKKEIVYKDDQPYCKLVKSGGLTPRFSVRNLDDQELMVAQFSNEQQRYNVSFQESGQVCFMGGTAGFGKILAKDIIACNVIADGKIRPAGERCFLQAHGGSGDGDAVREASDDGGSGNHNSTADRDHNKPVLIFGSKISQDNVLIGTYSVRNTTSEGKVVKIFSFMLPGGEKAADAYVEGVNAKSCRIMVLKNNKWNNLSINSFDDMGMAKEIASWLAGRYYL